MKFNARSFAILAGMLCLSSLAQAHTGAGATSGFAHGLAHPIFGLDHLLAMVAVGLWAAQRGGRALWVIPATFVGVMALGGVLGAGGVAIPFIETGITASVLVLGVLIVAAVRMPLVAASLLVAVFALCHGHAHGTEMPATAMGLSYGLGFILATAAIHGIGIGAGQLAQRASPPRMIRYAGCAIVVAGLLLCIV